MPGRVNPTLDEMPEIRRIKGGTAGGGSATSRLLGEKWDSQNRQTIPVDPRMSFWLALSRWLWM